jgi:hypothetical protein
MVQDLVASDNLYGVGNGGREVFWHGGIAFLDVATWQASTGTDSGSQVEERSVVACSNW